MDMTGERRIPAPRTMVWDALNNPEILKECIPGCQSLVATSPQDFEATAAVKIGPISTRFNGKVHLSDIDPPNGYTISGEGQGGVAGFAKGGAQVHLAEEAAEATLLTYEVKAQVGGKMAQLGARMIDSTAKSMADTFFNNFTRTLTRKMEPEPEMAPAPATNSDSESERKWEAGAEAERERVFPSAPSRAAVPVDPAAIPRSAADVWSMIPREPMGFPLVAWIGCAIYVFIFFLILGPLL
jgi:carbon monoxide dehydrogenase subunit G